MIAVVDYGLGNIRAFVNVYERLNIRVIVARAAIDLGEATKIILPGVGAFDNALLKLNNSGMRDSLDTLVLEHRTPVLGICVGMQMLARASEEGKSLGLDWVGGTVRKFDKSAFGGKVQLPHMGWNSICLNKGIPLLAGLDKDSRFYFLHSYFFQCDHPEDTIATTEYGIHFSSAISNGNIYGVQFHPEKSHHWGIQLLKNFADL